MHLRSVGALTLAVALTLGLATGCKKEATKTDKLSINLSDEMVKEVSDVIITLPSPLELASLLKKSNAAYNGTLLNNPKSYDKYTDQFRQALNMGVYGADLGYVAYYDKPQEATNYLSSINKLGTSLNVLGAFEADLLQEIEKNISNQEALLRLITVEFDKAESHLRSVQRADVATAILAGGWVEGLYLSTQINKAAPNELIRERIGETKLSLNSLLLLLDKFKDQENFKELYADLLDLRKDYDGVKIEYSGTPEPPKGGQTAGSDLKVVEGGVSISTSTSSKVVMDDATLASITGKVLALRTKFTSVK
ncbi:MAG: hypothetical protein SFY70_00715 [Bacteroidia bacterium]|nr:hypothetical protein [Bacteroidia bacterium]